MISDVVNVRGAAGSPSPIQISVAKSARILRRMVTSRYMTINIASPKPYLRIRSQRSSRVICTRSERASTSNRFGGGVRASIVTPMMSGIVNRPPAAAGIQYSETPIASSQAPTDFVAPSAKMKLAQSPAESASVTRRPSRNPITSPKTMPSGSPFINIKTAFHGGGTAPNRIRATSLMAMSPSSV